MRKTKHTATLPEGYLLSKALRGLRRYGGRPGFTFLFFYRQRAGPPAPEYPYRRNARRFRIH